MQSSDISFSELKLSAPIQEALKAKNYTHPSPIQARAIPHILDGRDLIGCAQTGTGKTAAFALPILQLLTESKSRRTPRRPRALILTPTRELAAQIMDNFEAYGSNLPLTSQVVFGGVGINPQINRLSKGTDILVATPGRLLDLAQQGKVFFDSVEIFVLDEADRMLDMGFIHDVKKVIQHLPPRRQSLLFSATMPDAIIKIADTLLHNPEKVEVTPVSSTAERIDQRICHVQRENKIPLLLDILDENPEGLALVFSRTKHGANRIAERLTKKGVESAAIHGNKSQGARERALSQFKSGKIRVLVATDIAARGIDVKGVTLVINYDMPVDSEAYVHRIGRTARAGADGLAFSLCEPAEHENLIKVERLIKKTIPVHSDHAYAIDPPKGPAPTNKSNSGGGRGNSGNGRPNRRRRGGRRPLGNGSRNAQPATSGAA
ncbi:DEAD/DEAH box helicase [Sulfuriroseicoccus oceanibius]|uniref:DEAD-box ATP-dependent RNA helicase RhpA n=1 Tax=Sulfuriroseicoccus oceanibius TaxID=2707525 RepID=A0A7T7F3A7_9BACT|nr:DEAD/DEAH box helicase [Sulfuriroseicoccus oceanibius]QQL45952.1 DEAD/DEAH box helicase [Sulfuriroseicoccus oceanibius]